MSRAEQEFEQLPITTLAGSSFSNFRKITKGRTIDKEFRKKFLLSKLVSVLMEPLRLWENICWKRRIDRFEMLEPPVFIIGHWRSGTTYLHNLLAQDPQFGYCTTYQSVFPNILLSHQWWFRPILKSMIPERRPSDGVLLGIDLPQEEDFGLGNTIPDTVYNSFYFPKDFKEYVHKNVIRDTESEKEFQAFLNGYRRFAAKAMLNPLFRKRKDPIRRLLSKNPPHTARIDQLLKIYPKARFVYMHRDPHDTIASFKKFVLGILPGLQFQDFNMDRYEDALIDLYKAMHDKYRSTKDQIPSGNLIEVAYNDLISDPMSTVGNIYEALNIQGYTSAQHNIEEHVAEQKGHKASGYVHSSDFKQKVDKILF